MGDNMALLEKARALQQEVEKICDQKRKEKNIAEPLNLVLMVKDCEDCPYKSLVGWTEYDAPDRYDGYTASMEHEVCASEIMASFIEKILVDTKPSEE